MSLPMTPSASGVSLTPKRRSGGGEEPGPQPTSKRRPRHSNDSSGVPHNKDLVAKNWEPIQTRFDSDQIQYPEEVLSNENFGRTDFQRRINWA